ncbi:glycoside hydrolase family 5 protein [Algoriphagus boritolerans]|uniref:Endoglucanase n=1 Tax=Algoriphagus boritolerans DSM 17298 = JCM 18970 TaxID=1120964 RepID=A0A1H5TYC5_9BACT|nr:glycoside hydrolase family 5 protein [Algoriphagus boritolerans]SEF67769.1 endoglucanase [Algoriphagus boritolerans DSM 17298 = JCM 18970]
MHRFITIVLSLLSACSVASEPSINPPIVNPPVEVSSQQFFGQLKVQSGQLSDLEGNPVMLRGVSFGWHNWWPRFYNDLAVRWLKEDWNVNVVRAAMGIDPTGAYFENPDFAIEKMKAVIDAAIEEDVYVIIDWHSHEIYLDEAKKFFEEMAETYGHNPHIIYELYNEPIDDTWEEVKAYSEAIITEIRKHDPDNIILVGSPTWSQDVHLVAQNPIMNQENIMYVLHFYAATHKDYLRNRAEAAMNAGLPIFVSECAGMEATGNGPIDQASWTAWLSWMESKKVSWIAWSVADKDETCSMLLPLASSTGSWSEGQIKPWGLQIRKTLRSK